MGTERVLMEKESKKGKNMGILWIVLFVVVWVALQAYILPKLGIST
jgi:predicted nucleic acid-binding Zn ribbon protein